MCAAKGNVVQIVGKNSSGKTSTLDSIEAVIGGMEHVPGVPLRTGASRGKVVVELGDKTLDLKVTRRFNSSGTTTLTVQGAGRLRIQVPPGNS